MSQCPIAGDASRLFDSDTLSSANILLITKLLTTKFLTLSS